jgi:putative flavoprotein involved in K+ transport
MGHYDVPVQRHPEGTAARHEANHYVTGRDGGRDIDLRRLALEGMRLHGRFAGVVRGVPRFSDDLARNVDAADATLERINASIDRWIEDQHIAAPPARPYAAVWQPKGDGSGSLDLEAEGVRTVIWCTGFRSDWSWVSVPAFDGRGYPVHQRGVTSVPGLFVVGLPWLHTWGSARFAGVAHDAAFLADRIAEARLARAA